MSQAKSAAPTPKSATPSQATKAKAAPAPVLKDLYEVGEIPPLGHVPKNMYAWAIRAERHGEPDVAMQVEVVPTWELDSHDVLVLVMLIAWGGTRSRTSFGARRGSHPMRRLSLVAGRGRRSRRAAGVGGRRGDALGARRGQHPRAARVVRPAALVRP